MSNWRIAHGSMRLRHTPPGRSAETTGCDRAEGTSRDRIAATARGSGLWRRVLKTMDAALALGRGNDLGSLAADADAQH
jgi:hypothetical protein